MIDIAIARGDGIGPEIMDATLAVLKAANAPCNFIEVEVGEKVYAKGFSSGIEQATWDRLLKCPAFLKAPISTPQGGGFRSLNVTIRTALGLFANVRPAVAYSPYVDTKYPGMDVVIIRENEEDLYTGLEYGVGPKSFYALKVITEEGCERIVRYAFEYALQNNRKKVTCFTKDNILKLSDGLFHATFQRIAQEYPMLQNEHWIVDIGAAKLADSPESFDVIVMPNLYGDILSDVAAQIAGSVGLAGSANIGPHGAMFEAIHGSAPRRAGQNIANPSGLLLASVMMLNHLGEPRIASHIHNAWLKTIEEGVHTYDIFQEGISKQKVGTKEFAKEVIKRLGMVPELLKPVHYKSHAKIEQAPLVDLITKRELVGVDLFIISKELPEVLAAKLQHAPLPLKMIANRGAVVYPTPHERGTSRALCSDTFRLRFLCKEAQAEQSKKRFLELQQFIHQQGLEMTALHFLWKNGEKLDYALSPDEQ